MPDRLISVFGTYDFLGKSLPGMTLVIGFAALLPISAVPIPDDVSVGFLLVLSALLIVGLIGTLLGEFVHSLADILEKIVAWFSRRVWNAWCLVRRYLRADSEPDPDPSLLVIEMEDDDGEEDNPNTKQLNERRKIAERDFVYRQFWRLERWVVARWGELDHWWNNQIAKVATVVWSHRKIFEKKLDVIGRDDFRVNQPINQADFAEEYFIKDVAIGRYNVEDTDETDQVYRVAVSELTEANYDRAFRFQARYSFCRSMWLVLSVLGVLYALTLVTPPGFVPPELITGDSYIAGIGASVRKFLVVLLVGVSVVFAFASGSYKNNYIDYIISEIYAKEHNGGSGTELEHSNEGRSERSG